MGLRGYLSFIGLGTFLAWFAWLIILFNVSPVESGMSGLLLFYVTLAVALIGTLTLVMTVVRVFIMKREVLGREIRKAFRHSVLAAVVCMASLALSANGKFTAVYAVLMIAVASLIEYIFLQFHRGRG